MRYSLKIIRNKDGEVDTHSTSEVTAEFYEKINLSHYSVVASCSDSKRIQAWSSEDVHYFLIGYVSDGFDKFRVLNRSSTLNKTVVEDCKRVSGNFVLVAINSQSCKVVVTCDICSVIPFYWTMFNGELHGGSSPTSLVNKIQSRKLDEENFFRALTSVTLKSNRSLFENVSKLHALSAVEYDLRSYQLKPVIHSVTNESLFFDNAQNKPSRQEQFSSLSQNLKQTAKVIKGQGSALTQLSSGLDSGNIWAAMQAESPNTSLTIYSGFFDQTGIEDVDLIKRWLQSAPSGTDIYADENVVDKLVAFFHEVMQQDCLAYPINSHTTFPAVRASLGSCKRYAVVTGEGGDELFALGPQVLLSLLFTGKRSDMYKFFDLRKKIIKNNYYNPKQISSGLGMRGLLRPRGKIHCTVQEWLGRNRKFVGLDYRHSKRLFHCRLDYEPEKKLYFPWENLEYCLLSNLKLIQSSYWLEKEFHRADQSGFDLYHPFLEYTNISLVAKGSGEYLWADGYRKKPLYESLQLLKPTINYENKFKGSHFAYYPRLLAGSNEKMGEYKSWELVKRGYFDSRLMEELLDVHDNLGYKFHIIPFELFLRSFK